jgi:SAM-dependent methyltransferase
MSDPTTRFSNRTAHYRQSRPSYPKDLVDALWRELRLSSGSVVADIGSGTGISTKLLLDRGCVMYAVEPNDAMRAAAEEDLGERPHFHSVNGTAEHTTLGDASVDAAVSMQAFHWFDRAATRHEFARILKPGGRVALVWNERRIDTPFLVDYENLLLTLGTDYAEVRHNNITGAELNAFFGGPHYRSLAFENAQYFDFPGLRARLLSSSYAPAEQDPASKSMLDKLRRIFDTHQSDQRVEFLYRTMAYVGEIA